MFGRVIGRMLSAVGLLLVTLVSTPVRSSSLEVPGPFEGYVAIRAASDNGRYIVVERTGIYSATTWIDRLTGATKTLPPKFVALSGDGEHVLSQADGLTWLNVNTGAVVRPDVSAHQLSSVTSASGSLPRQMSTDGRFSIVRAHPQSLLLDASTGALSPLGAPYSLPHALSADGRLVLINEPSCAQANGCSRSVLLDRETGARSVLGEARAGSDVIGQAAIAMSDDGRYVMLLRGKFLADSIDFETGRLVRLDRASGRSVDLAGAFDFLPGPQLSADGQHLIGVQRDGTVVHVDASSGARSTLFTAGLDLAGGPLIPELAPDGSTVVHLEQRVVRGSGPAEVHFDIVETALAEQGEPRVHAGEIITLPIAGRFGVPSSASAVALNVTATNPNADGFVTVWPCDGSQPLASNLNYIAGRTVPNATISKLAANGSVCLYTKSPTDLVVDVQGYFPATTPVVGLTPARLLDTRNGKGRPGTAKVPAGGVIQLQVGGEEGIPAGARSAVLNVTVTEPDGPGFVTVYPCGSQAPTASNLNYVSGQTVANAVVSKLDDNGAVCLVTKLAAHLVVDVDGYALASANVVGMTPTRLVDTRIGSGTATAQKMTAGSSVAVHVAGRDGLPGIIAAATLNVTATEPAADGYLTAYPCGATPPTASNVNFESGQTVPNLVIAVPDVYGDVCIYASQTTHLVVDVTGALVGSDAYVGFAPTRAIDTRHS